MAVERLDGHRNIDASQADTLRIGWVSECRSDHVSGISGTIKNLAPYIIEQGHDITLISPGPESEPIPGVTMVTTKTLPKFVPTHGFPVGVQKPRKFKNQFTENGFDSIVVSSPMRTPKSLGWFIGGYAIDAATTLDLPTTVIAGTNNKEFAQSMGYGALIPVVDKQERRMHGRANLNLYPSAVTRQYLKNLDVGDDHMALFTRGIHERFSAERRGTPEVRALRESWGVGDDDTVILTTGRLAAEKSFHKLKILADISGTKLVLVGDGPERAALEKLLGDRAVFTGMLKGDDLANAYAAGDIFAYPSQSDTYAQVVPEAQASGLAVVAADVGGPSELIEHGTTGLKYTPSSGRDSDDIQLLHYVTQLVEHPELRTHLSRTAAQSVAGLTWRAKAREFIDLHRLSIEIKQRELAGQRAGRLALA